MKKLLWFIASVMALSIAACSSIDCPLNNTVYANYHLYKANGDPDTLIDTLTIYTKRHNSDADTILLNRSVDTKSFSLPMSYAGNTDMLVLEMRDTFHNVVYDTIAISKTNAPHFESTECSPSFFHTIEGVTNTNHKILSVTINDTEVTYDATKEHIRICFNSGD